MCTYCSTGDLHALWRAAERFAEATVRLFAAELVLVLGEWPIMLGTATTVPTAGDLQAGSAIPGVAWARVPGGWLRAPCREGTHHSDGSIFFPVYLHDLGIVHRDVKVRGSRAGGAGGWGGGVSPNSLAWRGHPSACLISDGEHPPG